MAEITYRVGTPERHTRTVTVCNVLSLDWDYTATPPTLNYTVARVGDGAPLRGSCPISRVVKVDCDASDHSFTRGTL